MSTEKEFMDAPGKQLETTADVAPRVPQRSRYRACCIFLLLLTAAILVAVAVLIPTVLIPKLREKSPQIGGARAIALACNASRFPQTCNTSLAAANAESPLQPGSQGLALLAVAAATDAVVTTLAQCRAISQDGEVVSNATYVGTVGDCIEILDYTLEHLGSSSATLSKLPRLEKDREAEFDNLKTLLSGALTFAGSCSDGVSRIQTLRGGELRRQANFTFQVVSNALAFVNAFAVYGEDLENWQPAYFLGSAPVASTPPPRRMLLSTAELPLNLERNFSDPKSQCRYWFSRRVWKWLRWFSGTTEKLPELSELTEFSSNFGTFSRLGIPSWVRAQDRRLLEAPSLDPNVTVAQDGSGNFKTIQEAVNAAPVNSGRRHIILIKAGEYNEIVRVSQQTKNVMFLGDGVNRTIITGNLSVQVPGITTFKSATVGVAGEGFMAKGITFQNTAGAIAQQAVALRVSADKSVLWQCSIDAFQDTLWAHAFRQLYKDCTISGTVDFIFGNAAAVLQSCSLLAKANLPGKQNVYTAQGRTDPGQCTGFSIQNCTLDGTPDLILAQNASQPQLTYLGRPWKQFSLTVYMKSYMSAIIDSSGWLPYSGDFALSTLFYGEYANTGPGAGTGARVKWSTAITDPTVVTKFQVREFLHSATWLSDSGIPYTDSL